MGAIQDSFPFMDINTNQDVINQENKHEKDNDDTGINKQLFSEDRFSSTNIQTASLTVAAVETALIIGGLLYIFLLLSRDVYFGDGGVRFQDLISLLSHHISNSKYSLIGPLFSFPLLLIGRQLGQISAWTGTYNFVLFSLTLLTSYIVLRNHINRGLLRKFFLILIVASMFTAHLSFFYGEVFTALFVGFGIILVYTRVAAPVSWIAIILGVANTPAVLVGLVIMMLKYMFDTKRLRYLLVIIAAGIVISIEAWIRHGSPMSSAYSDDHGFTTFMPYSGLPGFSYPFFFGLLAILFSFGKGLLFFAPGLLLPVRKTLLRHKEEQKVDLYQVYILWICFLIGIVLVYSRWWAWYGGRFWGPRFFLIASIPASFALAIRLHYRKDASLAVNILTLVIFCLSLWVGIDGALFQWGTAVNPPAICLSNNYSYEMVCYFIPEFSPLWLPFVHHLQVTTEDLLFLVYSLLVGIYLLAPLVKQIVQQTVTLIKHYVPSYANPKSWRI